MKEDRIKTIKPRSKIIKILDTIAIGLALGLILWVLVVAWKS